MGYVYFEPACPQVILPVYITKIFLLQSENMALKKMFLGETIWVKIEITLKR